MKSIILLFIVLVILILLSSNLSSTTFTPPPPGTSPAPLQPITTTSNVVINTQNETIQTANKSSISGLAIDFNDTNWNLYSSYAQNLNVKWCRSDVWGSAWNLEYNSSFNIIGIIGQGTIQHFFSNFTNLSQWNYTVKQVLADFPNLHYWEIWNEPIYFQYGYQEYSNPIHYLNMLKSAWEIAHTVNNAPYIIGFGGVYYSQDSYVSNLMSMGAGSYINAISIHTHPLHTGITNWINQTVSQIKFLQQYNLPIWDTEAGLINLTFIQHEKNIITGDSYEVIVHYNETAFLKTLYPLLLSYGVVHIFYFSLSWNYLMYGKGFGGTTVSYIGYSLLYPNNLPSPQYYLYKNITEEYI